MYILLLFFQGHKCLPTSYGRLESKKKLLDKYLSESLRVCFFGVIQVWISDPRSVWIMVHQRNRRIRDQSGFASSFDAP